MRHKESYAVETYAPTRDQWEVLQTQETPRVKVAAASVGIPPATSAGTRSPAVTRRRVEVTQGSPTLGTDSFATDVPVEVLVVVSKLKGYIKARSGMNTSDGVMKVLSHHIRILCDDAIRKAKAAERKTVMDRDFIEPNWRP